MIDTIKYSPAEYSKQSRDYQAVALLYTLLFNDVKMYADEIRNIWTDDVDYGLLKPRAKTLNFNYQYDWEAADLAGVTNCFKYLERLKGTKVAIAMAVQILARIRGLQIMVTEPVEIVDGVIIIKISENVANLGALEDILKVILPAGMPYRIIQYAEVDSRLYTWLEVLDRLNIWPSGHTSEGDRVLGTNLPIAMRVDGGSEYTSQSSVHGSQNKPSWPLDSEGTMADAEYNVITNTLVLGNKGKMPD